jgi:hypothetical protein
MRCVQEEGADQRDHKIRLKQGVQVIGRGEVGACRRGQREGAGKMKVSGCEMENGAWVV